MQMNEKRGCQSKRRATGRTVVMVVMKIDKGSIRMDSGGK